MISVKPDIRLPKYMAYEEAQHQVQHVLQETLNKTPAALRHITVFLAEGQGKNLRPALLTACAINENSMVSAAAVQAGAAVELLHMATLVHDDIIDDSPLRRGIPSVQAKYGKKEAVICGDYLFCSAFYTISAVYEPHTARMPVIARMIGKICAGEMAQHQYINNGDTRFYNYLKVIQGKTAALFRLCAYGGAILGDCPEKEIKNLSRFGNNLGMLFQIMDDCRDYAENENHGLKPVKKDIAMGIITLPLLFALESNNTLKTLVSQENKNNETIIEIINAVKSAQGLEKSVDVAAQYHQKGMNILEGLDNPHKKKLLKDILEKVAHF